MNDHVAWAIWDTGAVLGGMVFAPVVDFAKPRAVKIYAAVYLAWVMPVIIRAYLMVLAS